MNTVAEMYGLRPPRVFPFKAAVDTCSNPDLVVGLELETENCRGEEDFYITTGAKLGIDVKGDGSLRTINGNPAYEFITKPTRMANALVTVEEFLRLCKFDDENYSDRCSVHVHVNCTDLTFEQVAAVGLIYTVVEDILFKFVNDQPGNKDGWSRDTNIYCVPWNQCRDHLNLVYRFTKQPERALAGWQKYTALNILPLNRFGTMEWRHMHGTADMKKLTQWLNIIGAIYKHAKGSSFDDLVKDIQGLNTESHYGKFFDTVLGGQLVYDDEYRQSMAEGCILAKYSMIQWSLDKKNPGSVDKKTGKSSFDMRWDELHARAAQRIQPVIMDDIQPMEVPAPDPAWRVNWQELEARHPAAQAIVQQADEAIRARRPVPAPGRPIVRRFGEPVVRPDGIARRTLQEMREREEHHRQALLDIANRQGQPRF